MILSTAPRHARMYIHAPAVVFQAQVVLTDPQEYPVQFVAYDNVLAGAYTDIKIGMTVMLGTAPGKDDLGRQMVNDDATNIAVFFHYASRGRKIGEMEVVDNSFITVIDLRQIWALVPFIDAAGETFMSNGLEVGDNTELPPPVAIMGPGYCGTADEGTGLATLGFNGEPSYAVADAATITGYLWDIEDCTLLSGALTDDNITFTAPIGFRYISLTVTDSNGKTHTTWRPVFVDDPVNRISTDKFKIANRSISDAGQTLTVNLYFSLPRATYPNGTLVMIWDQEQIASLDRDHILFIGWHQSEVHSLQAQETGFLRNMTLNLVDAGGRLSSLPAFSRILQDDLLRDPEEQPEITWQFMPAPTIDKFMHYLIHWHSNLDQNCDLILSGTGASYPFVQLQAGGTSLLGQLRQLAQMIVPDHRLVVRVDGKIAVLIDQMVIDEADRTDDELIEVFEEDWQEVSFTYNYFPDTHVLWGNAMLTATNYVVVGDDEVISSVRSVAPGAIFGQGLSESTHMEQLTQSQVDLNKVTGHRYARINSPYGPMTIRVPGEVIREEMDFTNDGWVVLHCSEDYASLRGFDSTILRGRPVNVVINYGDAETGETIEAIITIELETSGPPAYTWTIGVGASPDDGDYAPPVPEPPPLITVPPGDLVEGVSMVAGIGIDGFIYRTSNFQDASPTWDRVDTGIAGTLYSWVVDPFSPGYINQDGTGFINGWIVNETDIYRVEDIFGTLVVNSVHTFAVATSGLGNWRTIQASFGAFFEAGVNPWLLVVSHYAGAAGHEGTYALRSIDGGVTWLGETLVSASFSSFTQIRYLPIGVYTSPKTPGFAYTAARVGSLLSIGFESLDWGATWEQAALINPGSGFAGSIHVPWPDNEDESLIYHGKLTEDVVEATPEELMPKFYLWASGGITGSSVGPAATLDTLFSSSVAGPPVTKNTNLSLHPPKDAVRVDITASWSSVNDRTGGSGSVSSSLDTADPAPVTRDANDNYTNPATPGVGGGTFSQSFTLISGTDWPSSREATDITPPTSPFQAVEWDIAQVLNVVGENTITSHITLTVTVTEIELDDGTIYTPTEGSGGREFSLIRVENGVATDISPNDGSRDYGVNRYGFTVRTHDSFPQTLLAAVTGNDLSGDAADDWHAVYISGDGGDSYTEVIAPVADSSAPSGRAAFEAAFAAEAAAVIFIWGLPEYIKYSIDAGATLQNKEGNLSTFSPSGWIGICGGPIG